MKDRLVELIRAFEDFENGVQILEKFRLELGSLDTIGFGKEAREIRAKLNDVEGVPFVRSALEELKEKIRRKAIRKREPEIDLIDQEGHEKKLDVYEQEVKEVPTLKYGDFKEKKVYSPLKKDAERLEKCGFKVKRIVRFKK